MLKQDEPLVDTFALAFAQLKRFDLIERITVVNVQLFNVILAYQLFHMLELNHIRDGIKKLNISQICIENFGSDDFIAKLRTILNE